MDKQQALDNGKSEKLKLSDVLNSALIVAAITAIVYFQGWLYSSSWYSFYSIDLSQIQIPTQVVLIHGIPGTTVSVVILAVSLLMTAAIEKRLRRTPGHGADAPLIALLSIILFTALAYVLHTSVEASGILGVAIFPTYEMDITGFGISDHVYYLTLGIATFVLAFVVARKATEVAGGERATGHAKSLLARLIPWVSSAGRYWQFGAVVLILIYLVMPAVISSEIGQIDALKGRHFMTGNKRLPSTEVHASAPIPALDRYKRELGDSGEYVYGPFALVYSDSSSYYLADTPKYGSYRENPNVYYFSRSGDNDMLLVVKSASFRIMDMFTESGIFPTESPTPIP